MDFFEHQDAARENTRKLVVLYCIAVVCIVLLVDVVTCISFGNFTQRVGNQPFPGFFASPALVSSTIVTLAIIALGTLYKTVVIGKGGMAVAESLGGILINPETTELYQKRVLNVVEEMAIASGVPVPLVYILPREDAINAFAAGFDSSSAVIGVTKGCAQYLKRSELQGVIAHEFSHILNGDMRLNLRLVGVLHGILSLALLGRILMQIDSSSRSSRRKNGGGQIALFGLALYVVGYVGVFCAKLIKSAVSRQREYLADASAVQFTRDPQSIAGALKKIGGLDEGSVLRNSSAEEASHMFFSNGLEESFAKFLSTHPPLFERIRRIDPAFEGDYPIVEESVPEDESGRSNLAPSTPGKVVSPDSWVGVITDEDLRYAKSFLAALPLQVKGALRTTVGSQALVLSLILREYKEHLCKDFIESSGLPAAETHTLCFQVLSGLRAQDRLPLLDLAIPTLRLMSINEYKEFGDLLLRAMKLDGTVTIFEYCLGVIVQNALDQAVLKIRPQKVRYLRIRDIAPALTQLVGALSCYGAASTESRLLAFTKGTEGAGIEGATPPEGVPDFQTVATSFQTLRAASPVLKRLVVQSCVAAIAADGITTIPEAELLRATCSALDCPLPPASLWSGSSKS